MRIGCQHFKGRSFHTKDPSSFQAGPSRLQVSQVDGGIAGPSLSHILLAKASPEASQVQRKGNPSQPSGGEGPPSHMAEGVETRREVSSGRLCKHGLHGSSHTTGAQEVMARIPHFLGLSPKPSPGLQPGKWGDEGRDSLSGHPSLQGPLAAS